MDEAMRQFIFEQVREVEKEMGVQNAIDKQLHEELRCYIYRDHQDGTLGSMLYQKLPPELRHQIFSYAMQADQSVHIFPPRGIEDHGYRLSLCEETAYDFDLGSCRCEDGNPRINNVRSDFLNNALFLVSRRMRREALDAFFATNRITFTCLYELNRFTAKFKQSSSKIQRLRLFERVDDYPLESDQKRQSIQISRLRLKSLRDLELHVLVSTWSQYDALYEDGLVSQLLLFALGPPPQASRKRKADLLLEGEDRQLPAESTDPVQGPQNLTPVICQKKSQINPLKSFSAHVRMRSQYLSLRLGRTTHPKAEYYEKLCQRLSDHLTSVFLDAGLKYATVADVPPLMSKPKMKTREEERPLTGAQKRGLLVLED